MKRALQYRAHRTASHFEAPDAIVSAQIDPESEMQATPYCPTSIFFFFNDRAPPEISTLPLHDALPIYGDGPDAALVRRADGRPRPQGGRRDPGPPAGAQPRARKDHHHGHPRPPRLGAGVADRVPEQGPAYP